MAIRDLFWACPLCGARRAWRAARGAEVCGACRTRFSRGRGAIIHAISPGGERVERSASDWVDRLPPILDPALPLAGGPARVRIRMALPEDRPVRHGGELLGWVEQFGPKREGALELRDDEIRIATDDGIHLAVELAELTAIQPASRSLQLGLRGRRTWSIRFLDDPLMWWDALLQEAVRRHWAATGRGRVACFQPQISCR